MIFRIVQTTLLKNFKISKMHTKCRNAPYANNDRIIRYPVPDEKVSWSVEWVTYSPIYFTADYVNGKSWADPDIGSINFNPVWNSIDCNVNRISHNGQYDVENDRPKNPAGRTGLAGRGCLGRWGPNHACDPIVTRWKRNDRGKKMADLVTKLFVLQFVAIERRDCKEWAIPGGMVDPGEVVSKTLRREFLEEALNSLEQKNKNTESMVNDFFNDGIEVYKGYVDDPRNTDNAWMETVAYNFHDADGSAVGQFPLEAGDDAQSVTWMDLHGGVELYASHRDMLHKVADLHSAHW